MGLMSKLFGKKKKHKPSDKHPDAGFTLTPCADEVIDDDMAQSKRPEEADCDCEDLDRDSDD